MTLRDRNFVVGRVVNEDKDFMLVEICKDNDRPVLLCKGDRFYTMAFVKAEDGKLVVWKPWR